MSLPPSSQAQAPTERPPQVVFVARAVGPECEKFLNSSLDFTIGAYVRQYGPLETTPRRLIFAHNCHQPFEKADYIRIFFRDLFQEMEETNTHPIVVLNGWAGLTVNRFAFMDIFESSAHRVTLRIYAGEPRQFFQPDVQQICATFRGDIDLIEDMGIFVGDTAMFLARFFSLEWITDLY